MKGTSYIDNCKLVNIVYPDYHNPSNLGIRAPYFYLHGLAEKIADYDCFNVSNDLMCHLLSNGVQLCVMEVIGRTHELLVFSQFNQAQCAMTGYAVLIDDEDAIREVLEEHPMSFRPCGGDTIDDYLIEKYPKIYRILKEYYNKMNYERTIF